jgi:excisionase family DNA binding protein
VAKEKEFYSFEEALDELRLKEEELKRLVSEGEIRAFRDGDTMKLRRQDVESLRAELSGGEVVDLGESTEELVFEDDTASEESGMATQAIADVDTIVDEVEDVGEVEIIEEEDEERPVRGRRAAVAVAEPVEEQPESMLVRVCLVATAFLLILSTPILVSAASGNLSGLAKGLAGIFSSELANL